MNNFFTIQTNAKILRAASIHSMMWGLIVTLIPKVVLQFFGVELSETLEFWQLFGVFAAVIGIGYFIASYDSGKYWIIILVGLLSNILASFVFCKALFSGSLPPFFTGFLLLSTAIWIIPFYFILNAAFLEFGQEDSAPKKFLDLIGFVRTSQNKSLLDLSKENKVLLVFVRQFGCTFCRETVSEISKIDQAIMGRKLTLVYVHMSDPAFGDEFFSRYYEHPVQHISDPGRALYRSLNLGRGTFNQLFGPMTLMRGLYAGIMKGHGIGRIEGDYLQLGGFFILSNGQILFEQKAKSASNLLQLTTLPEV